MRDTSIQQLLSNGQLGYILPQNQGEANQIIRVSTELNKLEWANSAQNISCRVYSSTNIVVPGATGIDTPGNIIIPRDSVRFNYGNIYDPANPTRLTAPVKGIYSIFSTINVSASPSKKWFLLDVNDTVTIGCITQDVNYPAGTNFDMTLTCFNVNVLFELNVGDYVETRYVNFSTDSDVIQQQTKPNFYHNNEFGMALLFETL